MKADVKRLFETMSSLPKEAAENLVERVFYDYHEIVEALSHKLDDYLEALLVAHCPYKVGEAVFLDTPVMQEGSMASLVPRALGKIVTITCNLSTNPDQVIEYVYEISMVYPINSTMKFPEKVLAGKASDDDIIRYMKDIKRAISGLKLSSFLQEEPEEEDPSSKIN